MDGKRSTLLIHSPSTKIGVLKPLSSFFLLGGALLSASGVQAASGFCQRFDGEVVGLYNTASQVWVNNQHGAEAKTYNKLNTTATPTANALWEVECDEETVHFISIAATDTLSLWASGDGDAQLGYRGQWREDWLVEHISSTDQYRLKTPGYDAFLRADANKAYFNQSTVEAGRTWKVVPRTEMPLPFCTRFEGETIGLYNPASGTWVNNPNGASASTYNNVNAVTNPTENTLWQVACENGDPRLISDSAEATLSLWAGGDWNAQLGYRNQWREQWQSQYNAQADTYRFYSPQNDSYLRASTSNTSHAKGESLFNDWQVKLKRDMPLPICTRFENEQVGLFNIESKVWANNERGPQAPTYGNVDAVSEPGTDSIWRLSCENNEPRFISAYAENTLSLWAGGDWKAQLGYRGQWREQWQSEYDAQEDSFRFYSPDNASYLRASSTNTYHTRGESDLNNWKIVPQTNVSSAYKNSIKEDALEMSGGDWLYTHNRGGDNFDDYFDDVLNNVSATNLSGGLAKTACTRHGKMEYNQTTGTKSSYYGECIGYLPPASIGADVDLTQRVQFVGTHGNQKDLVLDTIKQLNSTTTFPNALESMLAKVDVMRYRSKDHLHFSTHAYAPSCSGLAHPLCEVSAPKYQEQYAYIYGTTSSLGAGDAALSLAQEVESLTGFGIFDEGSFDLFRQWPIEKVIQAGRNYLEAYTARYSPEEAAFLRLSLLTNASDLNSNNSQVSAARIGASMVFMHPEASSLTPITNRVALDIPSNMKWAVCSTMDNAGDSTETINQFTSVINGLQDAGLIRPYHLMGEGLKVFFAKAGFRSEVYFNQSGYVSEPVRAGGFYFAYDAADEAKLATVTESGMNCSWK
ncbi:hypothetical protein [Marinibactrum halimedae]|uniref:Uncharacterized protein n=1 Tax=Marinibactrum halimedae TaxID=1444977 RepID=A0AA37T7K2_9GAMM|nr:hypothetical protein [Marinibactrum halimedae]MCD9458729.1 hypothetical protein [Marinibactrum halimedae]GLS25286.1 hypothetical protein GCM10007877_10000 [Marinibactrum halimedae]